MSIVSPKIWYLCSEYAMTCRSVKRLSGSHAQTEVQTETFAQTSVDDKCSPCRSFQHRPAFAIKDPAVWHISGATNITNPAPLARSSQQAITCVLPPETYSTTGSSAPVTVRPISMWPTQWLTPTMGTRHICDSIRATTAHDTRGPPMPGPCARGTSTVRGFIEGPRCGS